MKTIAELVANSRLAMHALDARKTGVNQTKSSVVPDRGIWPPYQSSREIESDCWVQPIAVTLTGAPAVNSTTPKTIAAPAGSIICLADLDVAGAADLTAPGGIARLVRRVARSLRRAEADVGVTSLGPDHLALQIQQECRLSNAILVSRTEVLGLERPGLRHSTGSQSELGVPQRDELGVEAALEVLGVAPTRSPVNAIFAEYGWTNVSGLGRVSFLFVADAPPSAKPRWVVVFVWMNGANESAMLEAPTNDLFESLGLVHYGKLGALDQGLELSASPRRAVAEKLGVD